jgi:hypothetical protein
MYRCNVSNQHETCYQQNSMYEDNAFNKIAYAGDYGFYARAMAVLDDEQIIAASGKQLYRCSTMNPDSCTSFYTCDVCSDDAAFETIAVGGGRIFAGFLDGRILSYDIAWSDKRVSSPLSVCRLMSVCGARPHQHAVLIATWGEEGYGIQPQQVRCAVTCCCAGFQPSHTSR